MEVGQLMTESSRQEMTDVDAGGVPPVLPSAERDDHYSLFWGKKPWEQEKDRIGR